MKFVDETDIYVCSGKGGNGTVSFRRERNLAYGGPDGGDGGDGGSVILKASENCDTLLPLARTRTFIAQSGLPGGGSNRFGKSGADIVVEVPIGTVIYRKGKILADLVEHQQSFTVVQGGKGGKGNRNFANAENQLPKEFTYGEPEQEANLHLELKLIADVGLVGFPNAGKSTLLSRLSAARPKIADYPFTTMQPQLGIVSSGYGRELVMADIPGIIEGASDGAGMGVEFLRHVERCRFLLHVVNLCPIDGTYPMDNFEAINKELKNFSPVLANKPQLVVGNKMDLTGSEDALELLQELTPAHGISAVTGDGLKKMVTKMFQLMDQLPRE